jgi:aspartate/methionine/tyrosine aminotransferase
VATLNPQPLVSVIMPAYNSEAVVAQAIESVLGQTVSNLELIVIDDASMDGTSDVIGSYAMRDRRIRLVRNRRNSRQGPIEWEPRNDGLKIAEGQLIAYLDADNAWRPGFVERLSGCLLANAQLKVVHCDSCNHHSPEEAARIRKADRRRLKDWGATWNVFSYDVLDRSRLGIDQYVDTNEMMHRASVFAPLGDLWRTFHPSRDRINTNQSSRCPYRRHNDLDLFERIVDTFGINSSYHVPEVLVDYYYPSAYRQQPIDSGLQTRSLVIHPQSRDALRVLNVDHFYTRYLEERPEPESLDLSVAEIRGPNTRLSEAYVRFVDSGGIGDRLLRYNGSATVRPAYQDAAHYLGSELLGHPITEQNVVAFDGCHEALGCALDLFVGTTGNRAGRDTLVYPVPSYPYWTLAAAGRHRALAIDAYGAQDFIARLHELRDQDIAAILVHWPSNPLGYSYSCAEVEDLTELARERNWGIVVDITYLSFLSREARAAVWNIAPERTVFCTSLSKSWGVPGLRLGFGICEDPELAVTLRAQKSARSLLPSSLKLAFFGYLLAKHSGVPQEIVTAVHARRTRFRRALVEFGAAELGIEIRLPFNPGVFEVLYIDVLCASAGVLPDGFAAALARDIGLRVSPDNLFYPPGFFGRHLGRFVRLSLGATEAVETVAATLLRHAATYLEGVS